MCRDIGPAMSERGPQEQRLYVGFAENHPVATRRLKAAAWTLLVATGLSAIGWLLYARATAPKPKPADGANFTFSQAKAETVLHVGQSGPVEIVIADAHTKGANPLTTDDPVAIATPDPAFYTLNTVMPGSDCAMYPDGSLKCKPITRGNQKIYTLMLKPTKEGEFGFDLNINGQKVALVENVVG